MSSIYRQGPRSVLLDASPTPWWKLGRWLRFALRELWRRGWLQHAKAHTVRRTQIFAKPPAPTWPDDLLADIAKEAKERGKLRARLPRGTCDDPSGYTCKGSNR